jgi:hypothetical protein
MCGPSRPGQLWASFWADVGEAPGPKPEIPSVFKGYLRKLLQGTTLAREG